MDHLVWIFMGLLFLSILPYTVFFFLYIQIQPKGSPADKQVIEPSVSILLPTYNEKQIIERKLTNLCSLDYPLDQMEIVVVDSSDDGTVALIREFFADRDTPSLTVVKEESRGVAKAINSAMDAVTGSIVFRTDADSTLSEDALRIAVSNIADEDIGAVTGRQTDVLGDSIVEEDYRDIISHVQILESHLDSTFICHGPCFAFEREMFVPLAPDSLADDTEIGVGIRRGGSRVVMDPQIQFGESGVSAFGKRRTRKDRRAMGLIQVLVRNRDLFGECGYYGRFVFPFNCWLMIFSPWLMVLLGTVATAALVSNLGLVGLTLPAVGVLLGWLGQRDQLGPLQPLHAVADAQVSLVIAQLRLVGGNVTGTWDIDRESREIFK